MKFNSHVIFLIAIVGIIAAGVVGATILNNGSMKQVDFDGIKVNVPSDAEFIKTQDGYADAKYGISIKTFQNNESMVNYLKGINGVNVVALKNQPPQSLAFIQGDNTNVLVTNGAQGVSIGAKDQGLVADMSNSVVFPNHQKSVKPKVAVPGIAPPPHLEINTDFNFIKNMLVIANNPDLNVLLFEQNINNVTVNGYNNASQSGNLDSYTANEFGPAKSSNGASINNNSQSNGSLLDNPQANNLLSSLSSGNSNGAAGGDSPSSNGVSHISSDASSSSASTPSVSSGSTSGNGASSNGDSQQLSKEDIQKFAMKKHPGKTIELKDITYENGYYIVLVKDSKGHIDKYQYDPSTGDEIKKITK